MLWSMVFLLCHFFRRTYFQFKILFHCLLLNVKNRMCHIDDLTLKVNYCFNSMLITIFSHKLRVPADSPQLPIALKNYMSCKI